jgi:hypothetical protein
MFRYTGIRTVLYLYSGSTGTNDVWRQDHLFRSGKSSFAPICNYIRMKANGPEEHSRRRCTRNRAMGDCLEPQWTPWTDLPERAARSYSAESAGASAVLSAAQTQPVTPVCKGAIQSGDEWIMPMLASSSRVGNVDNEQQEARTPLLRTTPSMLASLASRTSHQRVARGDPIFRCRTMVLMQF